MRFNDEVYSSRTVQAVEGIQGHQVQKVSIRPDCRRVRLTLDDGTLLLISIQLDRSGAPHVDADLVRTIQPAPENATSTATRREAKR
jgi:hypothetical protein